MAGRSLALLHTHEQIRLQLITSIMLIEENHRDVATKDDGDGTMRMN